MSGLRKLAFSKLNVEHEVSRIIDAGLREDLSDRGDVTTLSTIPSDGVSHAYFLAKADGVISGLKIGQRVFETVDPTIAMTWLKRDGDTVRKGDRIGTLVGNSQSILTAERLALNIMQRMSGVATQTNAMVSKLKRIGSRTTVLDTRKTAPGLRVLDKMAHADGGGMNHRMGLYDMIMIKDNHIAAAGGICEAIDAAVKYLEVNGWRQEVRIEVETSTLDEVRLACNYGKGKIHRVMLDNMVKFRYDESSATVKSVDTSMLQDALKIVNNRFETEASGNINLFSIEQVGRTNVDFVSTGSVTHSVTALDISLKFEGHNNPHSKL